MKKKSIITLLLALVFILILTAQVFGKTKFGPKTESHMKTFSGGTYHMKAHMTEGGTRTDMEIFTKGGRIASTVSVKGETTRIIVRDNKTYMIMESAKMIIVTAMQDASQTGAVNTSGMSYTGSGTANFAGKNLPYEEYLSSGTKTQFFYDGNTLAGIRNILSDGKTADTVVTALDQNVPDSVFTVPSSGYQVQDMSAFKF